MAVLTLGALEQIDVDQQFLLRASDVLKGTPLQSTANKSSQIKGMAAMDVVDNSDSDDESTFIMVWSYSWVKTMQRPLPKPEIWRLMSTTLDGGSSSLSQSPAQLSLFATSSNDEDTGNGRGESAAPLHVCFDQPTSVVLSRDGKELYVLDNYHDMIKGISLPKGGSKPLLRFRGLYFSPTVEYFEDTGAKVSPKERTVLSAYSKMVFDPVKDLFYVKTNDTVVVVSRTASLGGIVAKWPFQTQGPISMILSADGKYLFLGEARSGRIVRFDTRSISTSGDVIDVVGPSAPPAYQLSGMDSAPVSLALTSDGRHLFVGDAASNSILLMTLVEEPGSGGGRGVAISRIPVATHVSNPHGMVFSKKDAVLLIANELPNVGDQLYRVEVNASALQMPSTRTTDDHGRKQTKDDHEQTKDDGEETKDDREEKPFVPQGFHTMNGEHVPSTPPGLAMQHHNCGMAASKGTTGSGSATTLTLAVALIVTFAFVLATYALRLCLRKRGITSPGASAIDDGIDLGRAVGGKGYTLLKKAAGKQPSPY